MSAEDTPAPPPDLPALDLDALSRLADLEPSEDQRIWLARELPRVSAHFARVAEAAVRGPGEAPSELGVSELGVNVFRADDPADRIDADPAAVLAFARFHDGTYVTAPRLVD